MSISWRTIFLLFYFRLRIKIKYWATDSQHTFGIDIVSLLVLDLEMLSAEIFHEKLFIFIYSRIRTVSQTWDTSNFDVTVRSLSARI